jgi:predicted DNA-binding transcriptional regulator AlpA
MHLVTNHLVGAAEIAAMLGVTRQRVYQIVEAYPDFPAPDVVLASGRVWKRTEVEAWTRRHPARRPGRRPNSG